MGLYQKILSLNKGVIIDGSQEQTELRLSGLVVQENGYLKVYNSIYEAIFNQTWLSQELDKLRPYSEAINNWYGTAIATLSGLKDKVKSISFSPDGKIIASASQDGTIKLWQQNGTLIRTLFGHSDSETSVSFSPDGEIIASGSKDQTVKLWKKDGIPITTLIGHKGLVTSVSFSPDGKIIASASKDGKVILSSLQLDDLLARGCQWLQDYFVSHSENRKSLKESCN